MPSREYEMSFLVLGQRKGGRLVAIHGMAAIASIEIRRGGKLSSVPVAVTDDIQAAYLGTYMPGASGGRRR